MIFFRTYFFLIRYITALSVAIFREQWYNPKRQTRSRQRRKTEIKRSNPFTNTDGSKRYYTFDYYCRRVFGMKCAKLPVDGSFTCPNIDGTVGRGGCSYCEKLPSPLRGRPVTEQLDASAAPLLEKWGRVHHRSGARVVDDTRPLGFIPYFNCFSGTHTTPDRLRALCREALGYNGAVGLSIATRADCLGDEIVALLRELDLETHLTVELGLQTARDDTAERINRCHTLADFEKGWQKLEGLRRCVHIINGLPGEMQSDMLGTAAYCASLRPDFIKIHMLYIARGAALASEYASGGLKLLTREEYVDTVCAQLKLLPPDTVIARLTGDGADDTLIAPEWTRKKLVVLNEIDKKLAAEDSFQGQLY